MKPALLVNRIVNEILRRPRVYMKKKAICPELILIYNILSDAAVEESKKAAEKAATDASNAFNSTVDSTLKRVEDAADEGIKNASQVVDAKTKEADKYLNEKRDHVWTNYLKIFLLWSHRHWRHSVFVISFDSVTRHISVWLLACRSWIPNSDHLNYFSNSGQGTFLYLKFTYDVKQPRKEFSSILVIPTQTFIDIFFTEILV